MLVRRQGNDLLLSSADGDSVRVVGHFNDDGVGRFSITEVHFADGTVWTDVTLKSLALGGTVDSDVLKGYTSDELVHGNDSNDTISGQGGNAVLYGDAESAHPDGAAGDDLREGGSGADHL